MRIQNNDGVMKEFHQQQIRDVSKISKRLAEMETR